MRGYLTIGYCSRTLGYCFSYFFLEIFVGGQGFDGGDKVVIGVSPLSPPTGENPVFG